MHRLGIIGAGPNAASNTRHLAAYRDRCGIHAVADPDTARAQALAGEFEARAVDDFTAMLDDVDAVVISSPNWLHREHVLACLVAGKAVFCEKPVGLNAAEAREIAAAIPDRGFKSFVGVTVRFVPRVRTLQQVIAEGMLGNVFSVWSRRQHDLITGQQAAWRFDSRKSGGVVAELLAHEIDWMRMLFGPVKTVAGRMHSVHGECARSNDHCWITLEFLSGVIGTIEGSQCTAHHEISLGACGDEATAVFNSLANSDDLQVCRRGETFAPIESSPAIDKFAHFLDVLDERCASVADLAWGAELACIGDLAIDSALAGGQPLPYTSPLAQS
jgi:predicted dehydrogenase